MARWVFLLEVFLCLCSSVNGQGWRDRFMSFDRYVDKHRLPDEISTSPRFRVLAPDVLRADSEENLVLQGDGVSGSVQVTIQIWDFSRSSVLTQSSTSLTPDNGHHTLHSIRLPSESLSPEEKKEKFVYLKVTFEGFPPEEKLVVVSFHQGFIFIQTDKPIYNPGDTVRFRAYVSSPVFKATEGTITVDIKNPDGIVVYQTSRMRAVNGIFRDSFVLSELVNEGAWIVTAKFDHWEQNTFSSTFEVKKYVLPAFNVTLTPQKPFLSIDDEELVVTITARYLYGKPVQGKAYVMFGVKHEREKIRLRAMKQVTDLDEGTVSLTMNELKAEYPDIRSLVGKSIYVKASVLTQSGGDLVEVEKSGIQILISPFVLSFSDAPKYFKPGLPLAVTVDVRYHDGSPAQNVKVKLSLLDAPLTATDGTARIVLNMPKVQTPQVLTAETVEPGLRPEQQARKELRVRPYATLSSSQNLLYISGVNQRVTVGESVGLSFSVSVDNPEHRQHVKHITYMVLNKGRILSAERLDVLSQHLIAARLTVTPDMMPSFRVVAFYSLPWSREEEVVADSIYVDVAESCVKKVQVGPEGHASDFQPGKPLRVRVQAEPGSTVSLVAVDNSVYLLRRDRLTQSKVWGVVQQSDLGCSRGGGGNARGVFSDAGLLFFSTSGFKTDFRQTLQCPRSSRWRRSADRLERKAKLEREYKDELLRRCCVDGLRDIPMRYSCTRRSLYITEGVECIRAFRHCCGKYRDEPIDPNMPTAMPRFITTTPTTTASPTVSFREEGLVVLRREMFDWNGDRVRGRAVDGFVSYSRMVEAETTIVRPAPRVIGMGVGVGVSGPVGGARTEVAQREDRYEDEWDQDEEFDETTVHLRSKFQESWLWEDLAMSPKADHITGLSSVTLERPLPDSITEWGIMAVSASTQTGFCVAEPYNVRAWKPLFVDLKLPYSVARNEQVQIRAVIHNYTPDEREVRVTLMRTENMCSVAFRDRHVQEVSVGPGLSVVLPFTVVPLIVGKLPIEVMVVSKDMMMTDRVQKNLRVVMEGVQKTKVWSVVLNPSAAGGTQTLRMGKIELDSVVPNSVPETFINVRGNVLADSLENSLKSDSLAALIRMPGGCVEQNLASMSLPTIASLYLDRTDDWGKVGAHLKDEALGFIRKGYTNQLAYRRSDGSYPPYRKQGASTWITAFVVKVFSMAHSIIGVDEQQVCEPLLFLLKHRHKAEEGTFTEENPVYSTTMTGGLRGDDPQTTLTAFVLIALAEAKQANILCSEEGVNTEEVIRNTTTHLKRALLVPRRPYTVAIASYALALLKDQVDFNPTQHLLRAASAGGSQWLDNENRLFTLEATGYALLALLKMDAMTEAVPAFEWLNSQRRQGGGFGSTQPTVVVLQALSEYLIKQPPPQNLDLSVNVKMGARKIPYKFNPDTSYAARTARLPDNVDLEVQAQGSGQGILEVVTYYNQLHEEEEKTPCKDFELQVTIEESAEKPPPDVEKTYLMTIKVRALGPRDVLMVVLDVSLPTGFTPDNSDLDQLSNSVDKYIANFKVVDNLSDRGSLILHLFKVSHKEQEILIFKLQQNFKVGHIQPSSVTAYEYYNPDHRCSRSFSPRENTEELTQICSGHVCRCTQGDCCVPKKDSDNFSNKDRDTFACTTLHHVFKVKVLSVTESYYHKYELQITQVIKLGAEAGVLAGQTRTFMSHGSCSDELKLIPNQEYLVIGPRLDQWNIDSATNRVVYLLGKNTWVERWPSAEECSSSLRSKCESLNAFADDLSTNACRL